MLSKTEPAMGLSRLQALLICTFCACMLPESISATLVHSYASADIPIPTKPTRTATTNALGAWLSGGSVLLFGVVGLGMMVAAVAVRMVCRSLPPRDASIDPARALSSAETRTTYDTGNNFELRSPAPQNLYPFP